MFKTVQYVFCLICQVTTLPMNLVSIEQPRLIHNSVAILRDSVLMTKCLLETLQFQQNVKNVSVAEVFSHPLHQKKKQEDDVLLLLQLWLYLLLRQKLF